MATAAAAPPMTHCAWPVIMGMPPVLTLEVPELLALLLPELLDVCPALAPLVVAEVEEIELSEPVAPGVGPAVMVTIWAPMSVP